MDAIKESFTSAIDDFHRARNRATLQELLSHLTGETTQLLSYDDVRHKLKSWGNTEVGVRDIPLDAIVGSVGRYTDFTRDFLPRSDVNPERWARLKIATSSLVGLPPIEVYQIGDVYFVLDGNHRVSVARELGAAYIQAYVTEVHTRVPLTPDINPEDLILMAEYAEFLEHTNLDRIRPDSDLRVSIPGQYKIIEDHIDVHRYFMGLDFKRDIPYTEAVGHWYDTLYCPIIEIIRNQGILRDFPGRTETDLYLWIGEHRAQLEEQLGWKIQTQYAARDLVEQEGEAKENIFSRVSSKILEAILPDQLESGPPAGQWRTQAVDARPGDRMFIDILVPINGLDGGWVALEQAKQVAKRENAHLHGLHVAENEELSNEAVQSIQEEFNQSLQKDGLVGELTIENGEIGKQIINQAVWNDLIVVNLAHPPGSQPLARLSSGFRDLILHSPRPILATPQLISPLNRALLAFDDSPKAEEALFVAAYLAGRWKIPLVAVYVDSNDHLGAGILARAQEYLKAHNIQAEFMLERGPVAETILKTCEMNACDFIIMGGYGLNAVLEVVLGSTVDQILRESSQPTLICR